jgi:mono/diheme cytochrome c family protein
MEEARCGVGDLRGNGDFAGFTPYDDAKKCERVMTADSGCGSAKEVTAMRYVFLSSALLFATFMIHANGRPTADQSQFPPSYAPSGQELYHQFCAACHGADAKGNGPAASRLKSRPADLTALAKRHMGQFPSDYVASVLRFGLGPNAHGSSDMPTWGPIFQFIDKHDERAVQQRIRNLCTYLESLQEGSGGTAPAKIPISEQ